MSHFKIFFAKKLFLIMALLGSVIFAEENDLMGFATPNGGTGGIEATVSNFNDLKIHLQIGSFNLNNLKK